MHNLKTVIIIASFMSVYCILQTASAGQVLVMKNSYYNSKLDNIINNIMSDYGRIQLNDIFEKTISDFSVNIEDNNNKYQVTVYKAFFGPKDSGQPCREGKLIAKIGHKKYLINIIGCRNNNGVWSIGRSDKGAWSKSQKKHLQPQQKKNTAPLDELILD